MIKLDFAINRIKVYAFAVKGWSRRELARNAKVGVQVVRNIHDPKWNPTLNNLRALEKVVPDDFNFDETPEAFKGQQ